MKAENRTTDYIDSAAAYRVLRSGRRCVVGRTPVPGGSGFAFDRYELQMTLGQSGAGSAALAPG
jgi:hypothetical protein